jgi:hypothetical protein
VKYTLPALSAAGPSVKAKSPGSFSRFVPGLIITDKPASWENNGCENRRNIASNVFMYLM